MEEQGNLFKQRATHKENFTIIHNEILFMKGLNDKPIPLEILGLFWRIISLPKYWHLTISGLQSISGATEEKIRKCLNLLESLGYLTKYKTKDEEGKFGSYVYVISETLNQDLWNTEVNEIVDINNETKNNPLSTNIEENNQIYKNQNLEIQDMDSLVLYKVYSNKVNNNIYSNIKLNKNIYSNINDNKIKNNSNIKNVPLVENDLLVKNQSVNNTLDKQKKNRRHTSEKNQVISDFKLNSASVKDMINTKFSDQTEAEKELAKTTKELNLVKQRAKEQKTAEMKRVTHKSRINKYIEQNFSDPELKFALKSFTDMYVQKRGVLTVPSFKLLLKDLKDITNDIKEQVEIVNNSTKKSYIGFYKVNNQTQNSSPIKPSIIENKELTAEDIVKINSLVEQVDEMY